MSKRFAATVLTAAALALPLAAAPSASADTPGTGSASGSATALSNLICEFRDYLGMGGCVYHMP
ncbi:hypothetical protein B7C42_02797 [Nocardia cerradoensis]|uniref:Uncharacterized protein n=1 Tax=Nocardia cerradoensis TaxID=85688 RepID=A0A231H748_9NOCA|nr:hypothetical protein [Nocardia cerradoensis]OXR44843.1 hypothetical protein B7C42_02797 [Nocardia cerradoensis]